MSEPESTTTRGNQGQLPVGFTEVRHYFIQDQATHFARVVCVGGGVSLPPAWTPKAEKDKESWFRHPEHPQPSQSLSLRVEAIIQAAGLPQQPDAWFTQWDFRGKDGVSGSSAWKKLNVSESGFIVTGVTRNGQSIQSRAINRFGLSLANLDASSKRSMLWFREFGSQMATPWIEAESDSPFDPAFNDIVSLAPHNFAINEWERRGALFAT